MSVIDRVVKVQQNLVFLGGGANSLIRDRRSLSGQLVANRPRTVHRRKYVFQLRATHEIFPSSFSDISQETEARIINFQEAFYSNED